MGKEVNVGTNTRSDLRLRVQTVFSQVLEGHKTFADIAPRYGLEVPEFEDLLRHKVDGKDFDRLKEASEKYEGLRHRKRKQIVIPMSSSMEAKVSQMQESSTVQVSDAQKESVKIREGILAELEKELKLRQVLSSETIPASESRLGELEKEVIEAQEKVERAKKVLENTLKQQAEAKKKLDNNNMKLLACEQRCNKLENQLAEIDSKVIYLVAPDYKGKMPKYGTFITVSPKEGMTVEDVSKVPLMHEPTMIDLMEYADMEKAKEGYQYLQLVTKYFVESAEYNLLVDDPATINLLRKQELIPE